VPTGILRSVTTLLQLAALLGGAAALVAIVIAAVRLVAWLRRPQHGPELRIDLERARGHVDRLNLIVENEGDKVARDVEFLVSHLTHGVKDKLGEVEGGEIAEWVDLPERLWPDTSIGPGTRGLVLYRGRDEELFASTTDRQRLRFRHEAVTVEQAFHRAFGHSPEVWTWPAPVARREVKRRKRGQS